MAYAYHRFERQNALDDQFGGAMPTKRPLPEMIDLVERKLEWLGLHSMEIVHVCITDDSIQFHLVSREDTITCRLEIDRFTSAIIQCDGLPTGGAVDG